eukprot:TRINITY_DN1862_c0_g1_i1.p1 TRINITY_DN1862_c0_g1~~TRINITY_DN1862_c0_g1_i1.p1  ORF type:complete len:847 (+),score=109.68 TRINITY_DN1862_c0_g1_i1:716-3256(+)
MKVARGMGAFFFFDCNSDGLIDIFYSRSIVRIMVNQGEGQFTVVAPKFLDPLSLIPPPTNGTAPFSEDWNFQRGVSTVQLPQNSTGHPGVIVFARDDLELLVALRPSSNDCSEYVVDNGLVTNPESVALYDMNEDGFFDYWLGSQNRDPETTDNYVLYIDASTPRNELSHEAVSDWTRFNFTPITYDPELRRNPEGSYFIDVDGDGVNEVIWYWNKVEDEADAMGYPLIFSKKFTDGALTAHQEIDAKSLSHFPMMSNMESEGIALGDCNQDGRLDLFPWFAEGLSTIISSKGHHCQVLMSDRSTEQYIALSPLCSEHVAGADFGDFNNDGLLDLVVRYQHTAFVDIFFNSGDCTYSFDNYYRMEDEDPLSFDSIDSHPSGGFVDIDDDGDLDVVFYPNIFVNQLAGSTFSTSEPKTGHTFIVGASSGGHIDFPGTRLTMWESVTTGSHLRDLNLAYSEIQPTQGRFSRGSQFHLALAEDVQYDVLLEFPNMFDTPRLLGDPLRYRVLFSQCNDQALVESLELFNVSQYLDLTSSVGVVDRVIICPPPFTTTLDDLTNGQVAASGSVGSLPVWYTEESYVLDFPAQLFSFTVNISCGGEATNSAILESTFADFFAEMRSLTTLYQCTLPTMSILVSAHPTSPIVTVTDGSSSSNAFGDFFSSSFRYTGGPSFSVSYSVSDLEQEVVDGGTVEVIVTSKPQTIFNGTLVVDEELDVSQSSTVFVNGALTLSPGTTTTVSADSFEENFTPITISGCLEADGDYVIEGTLTKSQELVLASYSCYQGEFDTILLRSGDCEIDVTDKTSYNPHYLVTAFDLSTDSCTQSASSHTSPLSHLLVYLCLLWILP